MNSIEKITTAVIDRSIETSIDQALDELRLYAKRRQNLNLIRLVDKELSRKLKRSKNQSKVTLRGDIDSEIGEVMRGMVSESTDTLGKTQSDVDLLAGGIAVSDNLQLDLTLRRQLTKLSKELQAS